MNGICLESVTGKFPTHALKSAERDLLKDYKRSGRGLVENLPKLPRSSGGEIDIMVGVEYLKYFPILFPQSESGLTLFESKFKNCDGTRGIIAGPHPSFDGELMGHCARYPV